MSTTRGEPSGGDSGSASDVPRTALVTGATSGIGRATARRLLDRGYRVVGTCRDPDKAPDSARLDGLRLRPLDLRDKYSIDGFLGALEAEDVHVDILVNNAAESQSGPLEEIPLGAVERVFQVNVLGPVHLTQRLLPAMRERGYGRVVMISSMLASFPLAYRSTYVASKAAIEAFATAARFEMSPFGVWLTTVEPGSVRTGISSRRTKYLQPGSPHTEPFRRMLKTLDANEREGIAPERVARTIVDAVEDRAPLSLYTVGSNASTAFALRRVLPRRAVERVVGRMYGVHASN